MFLVLLPLQASLQWAASQHLTFFVLRKSRVRIAEPYTASSTLVDIPKLCVLMRNLIYSFRKIKVRILLSYTLFYIFPIWLYPTVFYIFYIGLYPILYISYRVIPYFIYFLYGYTLFYIFPIGLYPIL